MLEQLSFSLKSLGAEAGRNVDTKRQNDRSRCNVQGAQRHAQTNGRDEYCPAVMVGVL